MDPSLAAQKRSIRTIKTELEFLHDSSLLTSQQLSAITALLPDPTKATGINGASRNNNLTSLIAQETPSPTPSAAPIFRAAQNVFSEKQQQQSQSQASHQPPPPAYNAAPAAIATASALYAYLPTDSGDLALQPQDKIHILENMNADWARGRNERTGEEGIFPRSYVSVIAEEKNSGPPGLPFRAPQQQGSGYGNMPVDVANGSAGANGEQPNKVNEQGKKIGKKIGNAALFGAGATIGSNIVNSIF